MRLRITESLEAHNTSLELGEEPITKADLARALGVHPSQVTRWDTDNDRDTSATMVARIAQELRVSVLDLYPTSNDCPMGKRNGTEG